MAFQFRQYEPGFTGAIGELMQGGARAQAAALRARGQASASTLHGIGGAVTGTIGSLMQQRSETKAQEQADAMAREFAQMVQAGATPADVMRRFGALGERYVGLMKTLQPQQADGFTLSPGQQRFGPDGKPVASVPETPETPDPFTLSPGQQRFGADGQPVATVPATPEKPPAPPALGSFEDYITHKYGPRPTPAQIEAGRRAYNQSDDRAPLTPTLTPTMEANIINRLTTQWSVQAKPAAELSRQIKLMETGLDAAKRGDLAQGSQAVLVTFQKMLDPTSVVRESEYARSAQGLALDDRIRGAIERLAKGGTGVPLPELEKFAQLAREAAKKQSTGYIDAVKARIGRTADRFKIPRELVFEDYDFGAEATAGSAPAFKVGDYDVTVKP